ncbi:hypothetical protein LTR44_003344 [Exophiala sp. CCFEE 6388]|uniref:Nucleoside phosphorylase domain-containing protein n=1 Tax=Exophiala sideris TaxID=1016849 RepID=A0ABR0JFH6_9EURO|nr:hypothetical protein LTR69_005153 [Exophiala sideris]KAK5184669.1 hypothetical protein LTR44_003344 [Eurotiomycetes sp. CCFEE 6388]
MGLIAGHPVVLAHMPAMGKVNAATVAAGVRSSFIDIKLALVVGICGGVPQGPCGEIALGDVVVSQAVVQYDIGKQYPDGFEGKDIMRETQPGLEIASILAKLQTSPYRRPMENDMLVHLRALQRSHSDAVQPEVESDILFPRDYVHKHRATANQKTCATCESGPERTCQLALLTTCDKLGCEKPRRLRQREALTSHTSKRVAGVAPRLHIGRIGSGDTVVKSGKHRDQIAELHNLIAFEMEGAGASSLFPNGLVVKGVCDYADSHKNKRWQPYAAATAAAFTKTLLDEFSIDAEPAEQEESVRPLWHMPFIRSGLQELAGRHYELDVLEAELFEPGKPRTVALLGLGGVGKSRLAMEVAYRARAQRPTNAVFWVQATDALTMERDYLAIGGLLQVPGINSTQVDVKQSVCRFLTEKIGHEWLLVIDNADDATLWGEGRSTTSERCSLIEYLPKTRTGSILVTTRNRGVATYLAGKNIVDLAEMDADGAEEILANLLEEPSILCDRYSTRDLLEKLTCLPLAIVQAASYINKNQLSVKDYSNLLAQPEHNIIELLNEDFNDRTRYRNVLNPVAATWLISFKQIQERSSLAAGYLAFISCLGEKSIPQSLLPHAISEKAMIDAIGVLKGYAFLRNQGDNHVLGPIYDMHRLVRFATRNWLMQEGSLEVWTKTALRQTLRAFPPTLWENRSEWMVYLPHAQVLCDAGLSEDLSERYELLLRISRCLGWIGREGDTPKLVKSVVRWVEKNAGSNQQLLHDAYYQLGGILRFSGKLSAAEKYMTRAFRWSEKCYGRENSDTIFSMIGLAGVYEEQGRLKEAEKLLKEVQPLARKLLGPEDGLLYAMESLVSVYVRKAQDLEAEALQLEVLEVVKHIYDWDHPSRFYNMTELSRSYRLQGRLGEAAAFCLFAHKALQQVLGPEHPSTLHALNELVSIYDKQGSLQQAEGTAKECLAARTNILGSDHRDTLASVRVLAVIWRKKGQIKEAIKLMTECLVGLESVCGTHHFYTCWVRDELNRWQASVGWELISAPPSPKSSVGSFLE